MTDRYEHLARHADTGLGADEPGVHRFTRPTDKTPPAEKRSAEGNESITKEIQ